MGSNDSAYNARLGVAAAQLILAIILIALSLTSVPGGMPIVFCLLCTGGCGVGASLTKNKGLEAIFLLGSIGSIIAMIIVLFFTVLGSALCGAVSSVVGSASSSAASSKTKCQSCAKDYGKVTGANCTGAKSPSCDGCSTEINLYCKTATYKPKYTDILGSKEPASRTGGCSDADDCWVQTKFKENKGVRKCDGGRTGALVDGKPMIIPSTSFSYECKTSSSKHGHTKMAQSCSLKELGRWVLKKGCDWVSDYEGCHTILPSQRYADCQNCYKPNDSNWHKYVSCTKYSSGGTRSSSGSGAGAGSGAGSGNSAGAGSTKDNDGGHDAINKICDHIDMVKYASFFLLFLLFTGCGMSSYFLCCMKEEKEVQHASPGRESSDVHGHAKF